MKKIRFIYQFNNNVAKLLFSNIMGTQQSKPPQQQQRYVTNPQKNSQPISRTNSQPSKNNAQSINHKCFKDRFSSYNDLEKGLRDAGLESSNLIIGIDFTRSNSWNGHNGQKKYFADKNLHSMIYQPNLYQQVISIIGRTLEVFDEDKLIPSYGFGDTTTKDKSVFPFLVDAQTGFEIPCYTFANVLQMYNNIANDIALGKIQMSGPTSFAPLINKAIEIVQKEQSYHILLIVCDGSIDNKQETIDAIVRASSYPLSIICIGVGGADFSDMEEFDDEIPERNFDNFQFVNFYETMKECEDHEVEFARQAMQEIPDQYTYIKKHIL